MKKVIAVLVVLCTVEGISQVNLVPNPSFELYDTCPDVNGCPIYNASGWQSFQLTPDYFNACASVASGCSVPNNFDILPAAEGVAYVGFYAYSRWNSPPNTREYLAIQLSSPMTIGAKYYVSLKVNLPVTANSVPNCAVNNLGARFTCDIYSPTVTPSPLTTNSAHISAATIIDDTASWTAIRGSFIADSSYQFIVVGNFFIDSATDTVIYHPVTGDTICHSYYFVDDICVSTDSLLCGITSTNDQSFNNVLIYPNPAHQTINIEMSNNIYEDLVSIELFDLVGNKQVLLLSNNNAAFDGTIELPLANLPIGFYILNITLNDYAITRKIIHN